MVVQNTIDEVKGRANVYEVISEYVKLKKEGGQYKGLCPFHTENTASFTVSPSKNIYKCFGCGKSGDSIKFIEEHLNVSFIEAIKVLAQKYNVNVEEKSYQKNKVFIKPKDRKYILEDSSVEYFNNHRKISRRTLDSFKITTDREWMPKAKTEIPVICFNYYLDGQLVNIKFRGKNKDFKLVKDAKLIFYNADVLKSFKEIIICEGEVDALSWAEAGFANVVSVPNGAGNGSLNLEYLDNCWELFSDIEKIILSTDNDEPGVRLREELARRLGKERCFKVNYPDDPVILDKKTGEYRPCKDANEVLVYFGSERLSRMFSYADDFPIEGILTVGDDLIDEIYHFWEHGYPKGIQLGIPQFDNLLSFQGGQYTTVTGIPGSGKSEFIDYLMAMSIVNHEWKWGICSFENQPSSIHATKIMQKIAGKSFAYREDIYNRMTQSQMEKSLLKTHDYCSFIKVKDVDINLDFILSKFEELVKRKGARGFVLDPWNYIETNKPHNISDTEHISQCLTKIKLFVDKTGSHLILVAHPTKLKKENGKYEVPTMYSISGSAHFFNKTDNGISVYRDFETNVVTVYVQKVRFEWNGHLGYCDFSYNKDTRQYQPII